MATQAFDVSGSVRLEDGEARAGLDRLEKRVNEFAGEFKRELESAADGVKLLAGGIQRAAVVVAAAVGGMGAFAVKVGETAQELDNAAKGLDLTTREFSQLNRVFKQLDTADLNASLRTLNEAMADAATGGTSQKEAFEILGVAYKRADGSLRPLVEVMDDVAVAMADADAGVRLFAGNILFGEDDFRKMDGTLQDLAASGRSVTEAMREYEGISQSTVDANKQVFSAFNDLKAIAGEAAYQLGELIAPTVLQWFADLSAVAAKATEWLRKFRTEAQKSAETSGDAADAIAKATTALEARNIHAAELIRIQRAERELAEKLEPLREAMAEALSEEADKTGSLLDATGELAITMEPLLALEAELAANREAANKALEGALRNLEKGPRVLTEFGAATKRVAKDVREAALATSEFRDILRALEIEASDWDRRREAIRRDVERRRRADADAGVSVTPGTIGIDPAVAARQAEIAERVRRAAEAHRAAQNAIPGFWERAAESVADFVRDSKTSLRGLANTGIGAVFGERGAYENFKDRLRNFSRDALRFFTGAGLSALAKWIGGRGKRGLLNQTRDAAGAAAGGIRSMFEQTGAAAEGADRRVNKLLGALGGFGGLGIPGLGGLGIDLSAAFESIWGGLRKLWRDFLKPYGVRIWQELKSIWLSHLKPFGRRVWESIKDIWTEFLKPAGEAIWKVIKSAWDDFLKPVGEAVWQVVKSAWDDFLKPVGAAVWTGVKAAWEDFLKPVGAAAWDAVTAAWDKFLRPAGEAIRDGIKAAWDKFLRPAGEAIWSGVKALWEDFLQPVGKAIWTGVKAAWDDFLKPVGAAIWSGIKALWEDFLQPVGAAIWTAIKALWEDFLKPVGEAIWKVIKVLWADFLKPVAGTIWDAIKDAVLGLWKKFFSPPEGRIADGFRFPAPSGSPRREGGSEGGGGTPGGLAASGALIGGLIGGPIGAGIGAAIGGAAEFITNLAQNKSRNNLLARITQHLAVQTVVMYDWFKQIHDSVYGLWHDFVGAFPIETVKTRQENLMARLEGIRERVSHSADRSLAKILDDTYNMLKSFYGENVGSNTLHNIWTETQSFQKNLNKFVQTPGTFQTEIGKVIAAVNSLKQSNLTPAQMDAIIVRMSVLLAARP